MALAPRVPEGPRVRVAAALMYDDRLVLVRHRAGASTYHLLPGGGVRYRETLEEALIREVEEETGLLIAVGEPLLLSDTIDPNGPRHLTNIVFSGSVIGGRITDDPQDPRVEAVDLIGLDDLIDVDLRPPIAGPLSAVLRAGPHAPARYLGSLFTDGS